MRPLLNPALCRVWRDQTTLQVGVDAERAVVVGGLDAPCTRLLEALDGTTELTQLVERAPALGVSRQRARDLVEVLASAGVLSDAAHDAAPLAELSRFDRDRLAPDLASVSLLSPNGAPSALARRRSATVVVVGLGRVGTALSGLLSAAGIGRVVPEDADRVTVQDLTPWGPDRSHVGMRRTDSARTSLAQRFPSTRTAAPRRCDPDVVVFTEGHPSPYQTDELLRRDVAHLLAVVKEARGVVGPFVLPGRTACLRCQDLHRTDRDPAWPQVCAQLTQPRPVRPPGPAACDVALAAVVAGMAAVHVVGWIDSGRSGRPPSLAGTVEVELPTGSVRRRTWHPHPACGCQWTRAG